MTLWDDSGSDLTALESSDEDTPLATIVNAAPSKTNTRLSTQEATARSRSDNKSHGTPHLNQPRQATYSTEWLYTQLSEGNLDLDPEYQRGVVWSDIKQTGLIDSLMHNFYVPPLVFFLVRSTDPRIADRRICIDGKQRLTSIKQFMNGHIPHKDAYTNRKTWFTNAPGQKHKLFSKAEKFRFTSTQIGCVEYEGLTEEDEREIFQRVQMGVALTPAERMNALNVPYACLARSLAATRQKYEQYLQWGETRGKEFLALAQIILMVHEGTSLKLEPTSARVETFLNKKETVQPSLRTSVTASIDTFCFLLQDPVLGLPLIRGRESKNIKDKLSHIEFVMAVYLIHKYRTRFSMVQLSDAIDEMRHHVHDDLEDNRFSKAWKPLMKWVKNVGELKLKGDGYGPIASSYDLPALLEGLASTTTPLPQAKRKRDALENDMGSDETTKKSQSKSKSKRKRMIVESEDEGAVIKPTPPRIRAPTGRLAVIKPSDVGLATPSSKAATTVKRPLSKTKIDSASAPHTTTKPKVPPHARTTSSQTATPSVRPPVSTRTNNAVASSSTLPVPGRTSGAQRAATMRGSVSAKAQPRTPTIHIPTPPTSTTISNTSPALRPSQTPTQPGPPSATAEVGLTRSLSRATVVKPEPRHSPAIHQPMSYTTSPMDRLAPIWAMKRKLTDQSSSMSTPTVTIRQATQDPRLRTPRASAQSSTMAMGADDPEHRLNMHCDQLLETTIGPSQISPNIPPSPAPRPAPTVDATTPVNNSAPSPGTSLPQPAPTQRSGFVVKLSSHPTLNVYTSVDQFRDALTRITHISGSPSSPPRTFSAVDHTKTPSSLSDPPRQSLPPSSSATSADCPPATPSASQAPGRPVSIDHGDGSRRRYSLGREGDLTGRRRSRSRSRDRDHDRRYGPRRQDSPPGDRGRPYDPNDYRERQRAWEMENGRKVDGRGGRGRGF